MAWATLHYSKSTVDKAGQFIIADPTPLMGQDPAVYVAGLTAAFDVLNNFRAAHAFALNAMQILLRRVARSVDNGPLVAQRLKRVPSILTKLQRFEKMNLSRMQDIGGCRAVLTSIDHVKAVQEKFLKSETKHEACPGHDYILRPKEDGYRGIHLVYKFNSTRYPEHCGRRIEIQLRSRLMHSWATAVETVDTLTDQTLKTAGGEEQWKKFFRYMGSVFALAEKTPQAPDTPHDREELREEIKKLNAELRVDTLLAAYQFMSKQIDAGNFKNSHYFLLVRDAVKRSVQIFGFSQAHLEKANNEYLQYEKQFKGTNNQAVLVSVDSMAALKKAYPNYFGDTRAFVMHLRSFMAAKPGTTFAPMKGLAIAPTAPIQLMLPLFDPAAEHGRIVAGPTVPPPTVPPPTVPPPTDPPPTLPPR